MSIHTVFEKWKHLDHLLSDREWLTTDDDGGTDIRNLDHLLSDQDWLTTDDDGNTDIRMMILYESWQAIKAAVLV